jgi:uncharacterized membrane protein YeaQ/YmgE (transglycosylase-associated protein family)
VIGAIILGLIAGYIGRIFTRGSGVRGCLPTTAVGVRAVGRRGEA